MTNHLSSALFPSSEPSRCTRVCFSLRSHRSASTTTITSGTRTTTMSRCNTHRRLRWTRSNRSSLPHLRQPFLTRRTLLPCSCLRARQWQCRKKNRSSSSSNDCNCGRARPKSNTDSTRWRLRQRCELDTSSDVCSFVPNFFVRCHFERNSSNSGKEKLVLLDDATLRST